LIFFTFLLRKNLLPFIYLSYKEEFMHCAVDIIYDIMPNLN
jgi:hypothetical protein